MDHKHGFCVLLSLNLLILLVSYETEARKMVEGNSESLFISQDNHQQALKEIFGFGNPWKRYKYNQGAEDNHEQEISGFGDPFRSWYKRGAEDNHQQEISGFGDPFRSWYKRSAEDDHHQEISSFGDPFRSWYKRGTDDNHQQEISGFGDPFRSWYKRGAEDTHQQEISGFEDPFRSWYKRGAKDSHQQEVSGPEMLFKYKQRTEYNHQQVKKENEHNHSSFFFLMDDLKIGKTKTVSFQRRRNLLSSPSNSLRYFFPKEAVNSIPFSLKELPNVLQRFSFSKNSPQAKSMEDTLRACEDSPINGETKYCVTSAEAMLDFVQGVMGEKLKSKLYPPQLIFQRTRLVHKTIQFCLLRTKLLLLRW